MYTISYLDSTLKRFNCMQGLIEIGKLSLDLFNTDKFYTNIPLIERGFTHRQTVTQWGLSYLAYRLILVSNDGKNLPFDKSSLLRAHGIFGELNVPLSTEEEKISFLLRTAQEQFWWQEFNMPLTWSRYLEIYNSDPFFSESFYNISGLKIDEYFKLGLIFSVFVNSAKNPTINLNELMHSSYPVYTKGILLNDKIENFLKLTCRDYPAIRNEGRYANSIILPSYEKYEFNPLMKYPIVKGDHRFQYYDSFQFVVPNILLLLDKTAKGTYWDLRSHYEQLGSSDFLNKFGIAFEDYTGKLLKRYFGDENVFKLEDLLSDIRGKKRLSDWLVREDDSIYIFECKSALMPLIAKRTFMSSTVSSWVRRNLVHAVTQLDATIDELKRINYIGTRKVFKFILLLEELYIADDPYIKRVIFDSNSVAATLNINEVHILSVFELEKMEMAIHKYSLTKIIEKKRELDRSHKGNFLVACRSIDAEIELTNKHLESKFDEILSDWQIEPM